MHSQARSFPPSFPSRSVLVISSFCGTNDYLRSTAPAVDGILPNRLSTSCDVKGCVFAGLDSEAARETAWKGPFFCFVPRRSSESVEGNRQARSTRVGCVLHAQAWRCRSAFPLSPKCDTITPFPREQCLWILTERYYDSVTHWPCGPHAMQHQLVAEGFSSSSITSQPMSNDRDWKRGVLQRS